MADETKSEENKTGSPPPDKDEAAGPEVKVTEVTDQAKEKVSAGPGGDAGSGPTGGITVDEVQESSGNAAVASAAAFTAGLVTGLLIGWFFSD